MTLGKIRVGTRVYSRDYPKGYHDPSIEGYSSVVSLTKSSPYGSLSPYLLKTPEGVLLENEWQFSKCYRYVPAITQTENRFSKHIVWSHPKEIHTNVEGQPNEKYWSWREKGMKCPYPVRWPVGKVHSKKCLYSISSDDHTKRLDYIEARKEIYLKRYLESVVSEKQFKSLRRRLEKGENLLIIEVDGPHQESLDYYIDTYGVPDTFIIESTVRATKKNLRILLNDPRHPFGHGYCLATALLGYIL